MKHEVAHGLLWDGLAPGLLSVSGKHIIFRCCAPPHPKPSKLDEKSVRNGCTHTESPETEFSGIPAYNPKPFGFGRGEFQ